MTIIEAYDLLRQVGIPLQVKAVTPVDGATNAVFRIDTPSESVLVKRIDDPRGASMVAAEVAGLNVLRTRAEGFRIPEVVSSSGKHLLLEYIAPGKRTAHVEANAGALLAQFHQTNTAEQFGWADDNYVGRIAQNNETRTHWMDFFEDCRIRPMLHLARPLLSNDDLRNVNRLLEQARQWITEPRPSLVHGDLWSGNIFYDSYGTPVLIDPAVHYAHHEVDLAMTEMFGGFGAAFYVGYNTAYQPDDAREERIALWNLYPILVHVNLFGSGYVKELRYALERLSIRLK
jgi:fructosamine-3-kinase